VEGQLAIPVEDESLPLFEIGLGAGITLVVVVLIICLVRRFGARKLEHEDEPTVKIAERLKKAMDKKIRSQRFLLSVELGDALSDAYSGGAALFVLLAAQTSSESEALGLIEDVVGALTVALACAVVPLGFYQLVRLSPL
jgi:hypothetical protein